MRPSRSLAILVLVAACAPAAPSAPPPGGPIFSASFAADAVTPPYAARERAFQTGAARCEALGKRFVLVEEKTEWGGAPGGTIRYRCM